MEDTYKPSIGGRRQFYCSDNFLIQLDFHKNALVTGWMVHYPIGLNLAKPIRGIFSEEDRKLKLAFFIEWPHDNLVSNFLTVYSVEIRPYEGNKNRIFVEWLQLNDDIGKIKSPRDNGNEILVELTQNDEIINAKKKITFDISKQALGGYKDSFH